MNSSDKAAFFIIWMFDFLTMNHVLLKVLMLHFLIENPSKL